MPWFRRRRRLASRTLRFGSQGDDVSALQSRLAKLGYEPGPLDGTLGYLTQEALRSFQREYRLRVDGIAGPEVYSLLLAEDLPIHRRVHQVSRGETLTDVAKSYGIGVEAFGRFLPYKALYSGERLVFFDRQVWGIVPKNAFARESLDQHRKHMTGVLQPWRLDEERPHAPSNLPAMAMVELGGDDPADIHRVLISRRRNREALEHVVRAGQSTTGVYLVGRKLARVDGARYYRFVHRVKRRLPQDRRIIVALSPDMPRQNLLGGLDFQGVSRLVDQVVLIIPPTSQTRSMATKETYEAVIHEFLHWVPSWKIILNLPLYAVEWSQETNGVITVPYAEAMARAFRHGARLIRDDQGAPYYRYFRHHKEIRSRVVLQDDVAPILELANWYNLAGVVLDSLGMEDSRIWNVLSRYFGSTKIR